MNDLLLAPLGVLLILAFVAIMVLSGCTLSVSPDGTRTYTPNPDIYYAVGKIVAKEVLDDK